MADDPPEDRDKDAILKRRSRFIAIAMLGLSSACSDPSCNPLVCLEPPPAHPGPASTTTMGATTMGTADPLQGPMLPDPNAVATPCLEYMPQDDPGTGDPTNDPLSDLPGMETPGMQPEPPRPRVCLRPRRMPDPVVDDNDPFE